MTGIAAIVLSMAGSAPAASAATDLVQREGLAGCVAENGYGGACQSGAGLANPADIALSPDGRDAYVTTSHWNGVTTLRRDPLDAALRPIEGPAACLVQTESVSSGCDVGRALMGAEGVAVSPDGRNVYVAAPGSDAIAIFDRDPETGLLTQSANPDGCFNQSGSDGCSKARGLNGARRVAVSEDGSSVYVASSGEFGEHGGVAVFRRDTETGDLTQPAGTAGCLNTSGVEECEAAAGLSQAWDVALSPDGAFLYVAVPVLDEILVFARSAQDGSLSAVSGSCVNETGENGCSEAKALGNPVALAFDAGGSTMYAAAERADAIVSFDRNAASGAITEKAGTAGCVSDTGWANPMQASTLGECQNGIGLDGANALTVAPDGGALYATGGFSDGLAIFERHADGTLTQRPGQFGCITETGYEATQAPWTAGSCLDGTALGRADGIAVSADSAHVYSTAREGGAATFDVVPSPPPLSSEAAEPGLNELTPHPRDRGACRRAVAKLLAATKKLRKAVRRETRLRRRLEESPGSAPLIEALRTGGRSVKEARRKKHLASHRERRLCTA